MGRSKRARCTSCGKRLEPRPVDAHATLLPGALLLVGGLTTFYLVGLFLIGAGIWLWLRRENSVVCPSCGVRMRVRERTAAA